MVRLAGADLKPNPSLCCEDAPLHQTEGESVRHQSHHPYRPSFTSCILCLTTAFLHTHTLPLRATVYPSASRSTTCAYPADPQNNATAAATAAAAFPCLSNSLLILHYYHYYYHHYSLPMTHIPPPSARPSFPTIPYRARRSPTTINPTPCLARALPCPALSLALPGPFPARSAYCCSHEPLPPSLKDKRASTGGGPSAKTACRSCANASTLPSPKPWCR